MKMKSWLITLILSCCLHAGLALTSAASAQTNAAPENAHVVSYGAGWRCDFGFARLEQLCAPVPRPTGSRLTARGDDWECVRGGSMRHARRSRCPTMAICRSFRRDAAGNARAATRPKRMRALKWWCLRTRTCLIAAMRGLACAVFNVRASGARPSLCRRTPSLAAAAMVGGAGMALRASRMRVSLSRCPSSRMSASPAAHGIATPRACAGIMPASCRKAAPTGV